MSDLHQEIMDRAYDRWKADRSMSKIEFSFVPERFSGKRVGVTVEVLDAD